VTLLCKGGTAMYGLHLETPIRCGNLVSPTKEEYLKKFYILNAGLEDDLKYLAKVRCPSGSRLRYLRRGQLLAKGTYSCARWFIVHCECGKHQAYLFIDSLRRGELMPPDIPGWSIDPAGMPSPEDELKEMDLVFIATVNILHLFSSLPLIKLQNKRGPFQISYELEKKLLKITFRPSHANPLPLFAQLGHTGEAQPEFALFQASTISGEHICEFGNIKKKTEYYLHFLADSSSLYVREK
jgi:hypothetical protein